MWGTFLTGVGVLLLWLTYQETKKAVAEAKEATKAAQESVNVTRDIGQKQVKAYTTIRGGKVRIKDVGHNTLGLPPAISITLDIDNFGQSPMLNAYLSFEISPEQSYVAPLLSVHEELLAGIPPNSSIFKIFGFYSLPKARKILDRKPVSYQKVIWIKGSIIMQDVFGHWEVEKFEGKAKLSPISNDEAQSPEFDPSTESSVNELVGDIIITYRFDRKNYFGEVPSSQEATN